MAKQLKRLLTEEYGDMFAGRESLVLVDWMGITSEQARDLRAGLRDNGVQMLVVKNSLARHALKEKGNGSAALADEIDGPTAVLWAEEDAEGAVTIASLITQAAKKDKLPLELKACTLQGEVLDAEKTRELADIPDRETLLSMVLSAMTSPLSSLVGIFNQLPGGLMRCVDGYAEQGGGGEGEAPAEAAADTGDEAPAEDAGDEPEAAAEGDDADVDAGDADTKDEAPAADAGGDDETDGEADKDGDA